VEFLFHLTVSKGHGTPHGRLFPRGPFVEFQIHFARNGQPVRRRADRPWGDLQPALGELQNRRLQGGHTPGRRAWIRGFAQHGHYAARLLAETQHRTMVGGEEEFQQGMIESRHAVAVRGQQVPIPILCPAPLAALGSRPR
jgi:hypothetical protein